MIKNSADFGINNSDKSLAILYPLTVNSSYKVFFPDEIVSTGIINIFIII